MKIEIISAERTEDGELEVVLELDEEGRDYLMKRGGGDEQAGFRAIIAEELEKLVRN